MKGLKGGIKREPWFPLKLNSFFSFYIKHKFKTLIYAL